MKATIYYVKMWEGDTAEDEGNYSSEAVSHISLLLRSDRV